MKNIYYCIGTMSGTSLDGLDIALCQFEKIHNHWNFKIHQAQTFPYNNLWKKKLSTAENLSGLDLFLLNNEFGNYTGEMILNFLTHSSIKNIDFIASHGHTVFHQPSKKLTLQIGSGAEIVSKTNITTICDFRTTDVALKGQGAPLVPIGDKLLFSEYTFCLNLGGFANLSYDDSFNMRKAYDICPVNIILNYYARKLNLNFDENGNIACNGLLNNELLKDLNNNSYYKIDGPKSLGKEWLISEIIPVIEKYPISIEDKMRTLCEHIAFQIQRSVNIKKEGKILITGGGAYNTFLINLIRSKTQHIIEVPVKEVVDFKEALIFGFLGLLRYTGNINCLSSVTGAIKDNIGGAIYISSKM